MFCKKNVRLCYGLPLVQLFKNIRDGRKHPDLLLFSLVRSGKNMEREVFRNASSQAEYVAGITRLGKQQLTQCRGAAACWPAPGIPIFSQLWLRPHLLKKLWAKFEIWREKNKHCSFDSFGMCLWFVFGCGLIDFLFCLTDWLFPWPLLACHSEIIIMFQQ